MSEHIISSEAALREVIGAEIPGLSLKNQPELDEFALAFLAEVPFLVLTTSNAEGQLDASPKGDAPGFVLVEDNKTIVIADRPGNKLAYGHLNIIANPNVGLLCMIPGTPETLRINGRAELTKDPVLLEKLAARSKPAVLGIRVHVEECFFHCAKAYIRSDLWKPKSWPARHKVSFGAMLAKRNGGDKQAEQAVDAMVEDDYKNNL